MRAAKNGLWSKIVHHLTESEPCKVIIDSQSAKTTSAAVFRGFDGKKTKGRKRHIVADLYGNILAVKVHSASIHDTKAGLEVSKNAVEIYPSIESFSADGGYRGTFIAQVNQFLKREVGISKKIKSQGFNVIKDR